MTRHLELLRHAKSSWDDAALADHERPLNRRGVDACAAVARDLSESGAGERIGLVLCSTAVRTRETLELIESGLGDPEIRFERRIYEASPADLLALIAGDVSAEERAVLVIGHNPAIGILASELAAGGPPDELERMREKFPTAARASLAIDVAWTDLAPGAARLERFVRPKDLQG